jgi:hypothetical protein
MRGASGRVPDMPDASTGGAWLPFARLHASHEEDVHVLPVSRRNAEEISRADGAQKPARSVIPLQGAGSPGRFAKGQESQELEPSDPWLRHDQSILPPVTLAAATIHPRSYISARLNCVIRRAL